jgi:RNase P subunit RPR2
MKSEVCKKFCSFYKPGKKEDMKCGSYDFLERNLTAREIKRLVRRISTEYDLSEDSSIRNLVCSKCEYLKDGCDFRQGLDSPPCGGYKIVEHLLKWDV